MNVIDLKAYREHKYIRIPYNILKQMSKKQIKKIWIKTINELDTMDSDFEGYTGPNTVRQDIIDIIRNKAWENILRQPKKNKKKRKTLNDCI